MVRCNLCKQENPISCGLKYCPVFRPSSYSKKTGMEGKDHYSGQAPGVFVGEYGYPNLNVGILGNENITSEYDNPKEWIRKEHSINKIIDLRSSLLNSRSNQNIKSFNQKIIETGQEIAMARKPADVDVNLLKKPTFDLSLSKYHIPHGPTASLKKAILTSNTTVDKKIEKAFYDSDLKSVNALNELSGKGIEEHQLTKVLSIGMLGVKTQRKLVPTKWSITAVDDTIGKKKIEEVKKYENYCYKSYYGSYHGNYFLILFFDQPWSYELFENHLPTGGTTTDHESYSGRKNYATETAGGYYATRIGILENLLENKKQAGVLALRFITDEYYAPLGVWVVRQAARNAMQNPLREYNDWNEMLVHSISFIAKRFGQEGISALQQNLKRSKLLKEHRTQNSLSKYF